MSPAIRRQVLIDRMSELESSGKSCMGCAGNCCTFEANSMMVTPLEAAELMKHLKQNKKNSTELKERCKNTVKQYRLDHQFGNGKKSYLRRTYTCPFFNHKELGCALSRQIKPYGCLAFNVHHSEIKASEHCFSEKDLLQKRDEMFAFEEKINLRLKNELNLIWDKSPLPLALLDLWEKEINDVDLESH